jgi:hypothetical protein
MTLATVIKGPEGVVLAAESRVTLRVSTGGRERESTFDHATKVLNFGAPNTGFGAVTYGVGVLGRDRTAASFVPEFEATLPGEAIPVAEFASRLGDFFRDQWQANPPTAKPGDAMSFLVAGFDADDAYARVFQLDVPITVTPIEHFLAPHQPPFGARWGGQKKIVERLLAGFDPLLPEMVRHRLGLDPKQMDEMREAVSALELSVPWQAMALQDCIDLAIFGIRSTISAQALSLEVRGCGGAIDVAVITRRDGLRFVQRKVLVGDNPTGRTET